MNKSVETYIRCASCYKIGKIIDNNIPERCPYCKSRFNKYADREGILSAILNVLTGNKERGYYPCDRHGWVEGDDWEFPHGREIWW